MYIYIHVDVCVWCVCVCVRYPLSITIPSQPDGDAGDLIVILQEEDHPVFKRQEIDLVMEKTVTLSEALCGCEFIVKHLDGQQLLVKTRPGEVIAPGKRVWSTCLCVCQCVCVCVHVCVHLPIQSHAGPVPWPAWYVGEGENRRGYCSASHPSPDDGLHRIPHTHTHTSLSPSLFPSIPSRSPQSR